MIRFPQLRLPRLKFPKFKLSAALKLTGRNRRFVIILLVILILASIGQIANYYRVKIAAQKKQAEHERVYNIICHNGGRTYYREYIKNPRTHESELREGCR